MNDGCDSLETAPAALERRSFIRNSAAALSVAVSGSAAFPSEVPTADIQPMHWWESGLFENTCVKVGSTWLISRLVYRGIAPADRMLEQVCAAAPGVGFTSMYPQKSTGPDRLLTSV